MVVVGVRARRVRPDAGDGRVVKENECHVRMGLELLDKECGSRAVVARVRDTHWDVCTIFSEGTDVDVATEPMRRVRRHRRAILEADIADTELDRLRIGLPVVTHFDYGVDRE